jgi:hypothetical protein
VPAEQSMVVVGVPGGPPEQLDLPVRVATVQETVPAAPASPLGVLMPLLALQASSVQAKAAVQVNVAYQGIFLFMMRDSSRCAREDGRPGDLSHQNLTQ